MRRAILSCLLLVSLGGCAEPPPIQNTADAVAPRRATLRAGDVHRYTFSWSASAKGEAEMLAGTQVGGDVAMDGELVLTVLDATDDDVTIGFRFDRIRSAEIGVLGQNVLADTSGLLKDEAVVVLPRDGRPREVLFGPDATPIFRSLMRGVLTHVDLVVPDDEGFSRTGPTGNGLATLRYRPVGDGSFERTVEDYQRVDAFDAGVPTSAWEVQSQGRITLGDDALAERIELEETLALVPQEIGIAFGAQTRFSMRRIDSRHEAPRPTPPLVQWTADDLFEAPDRTEAEREMARKFAEGLTMAEVHIQVAAADSGRPHPDGFFVRARGLLRGWPELADDLRWAFERHQDTPTRELIFDLLVSADTQQAQDVLVDLTLDALENDPVQAQQLVQHFVLVRTPTPALATTLLDVHRAAEDGDDEMLRVASLYPIGSVAAQLQFREPALAERMLGVLRDELAHAERPLELRGALAGLGNAARPEDLPGILAHRSHPDDNVRIQVASSLRHARAPEATDALYAYLGDHSRDVAAASLSVIDAYRRDEDALHRLAADVIAGVTHPDLGGPLVGVLARRGLEDDLCREALGVIHERTEDGRLRVRIARILDLQLEPT